LKDPQARDQFFAYRDTELSVSFNRKKEAPEVVSLRAVTLCIFASDSRIGRKTPPHGLHLEPSLLLSINKVFKSGVVVPGTEFSDFLINSSDLSTSPLTKNTS
jgi:hypothetical protein